MNCATPRKLMDGLPLKPAFLVGLILVLMMTANRAHAVSRDSTLSNFLDQLVPSRELLPAEKAFKFSARLLNRSAVELSWQIAPGYYLYREKFAF